MEREQNLSGRVPGCLGAIRERLCSLKIIMPVLVLGTVWLLAGAQSPAGSPSTQGESGLRALARPSPVGSSNRCTACHRMDPMFSHPVEVTPSMPVPEDLPLEMGKITCLTCHQEGGPDLHARSAQTHDGMLRAANAQSLCVQCHTSGAATPQAMHPLGLGRAHLQRSTSTSSSSSLLSRGLDAESRACMTCHDGMLAPEGDGGQHFADDTSRDHPIGVPYGDSRLARGLPPSSVPLRPAATVDPRIRLFNNQIGCGSCHSLYSNQKKHLVMSNLGSKLCLSCHRA